MSNKKCDYCGGITPDDMRGNCAACGAPRNVMYQQETFGHPLEIYRNVSLSTAVATGMYIPSLSITYTPAD